MMNHSTIFCFICICIHYYSVLVLHLRFLFFPQVLNDSAFYVICNGKRLGRGTVLEDSKTYHLVPRLVGGKGGKF